MSDATRGPNERARMLYQRFPILSLPQRVPMLYELNLGNSLIESARSPEVCHVNSEHVVKDESDA